MEPTDSTPFRFLRGLSRIIVRGYHDVRVVRGSTVPKSGPAIVAPNHTASLDPVIIQALIARPIIWMMAAEYADLPGTAWLWKYTRVILVQRDGKDSAALRAALRVLKVGGVLGLFPEGRIERTPDLLPLQPGIAALSAKTGAPIIPVWLEGSQRRCTMVGCLTSPNAIDVTFGDPLLAPLEEIPDLLVARLESLRVTLQPLQKT